MKGENHPSSDLPSKRRKYEFNFSVNLKFWHENIPLEELCSGTDSAKNRTRIKATRCETLRTDTTNNSKNT